MTAISGIFDWLAGGSTPYMTLYHCMAHDLFWVSLTVTLDIAVAAGYVLIAIHWQRNQRLIADSQARKPLNQLRNIFIFCGICGYVFIPIKMFWPAWRLYDMVMIVLVYTTWRYALSAGNLKIIFHQLHRSSSLEQELAVAKQLAERKRFFLNAVSHDLRNPVQAVAVHAAVAAGAISRGDEASAQAALKTIQESIRQTSDLLADFNDLGRIEQRADTDTKPALLVDVDPAELIREVADELTPNARAKGLRIVIESPIACPCLKLSDRVQLRRVLVNLVSNAIKYTQSGRITLRAVHDSNHIRLEIQDTGPGIAPEVLKDIFDEFYQADNLHRDRSNGFGLGLAIAKRFTEALGGRIWADSQEGRGTGFSIEFPILNGSVASPKYAQV